MFILIKNNWDCINPVGDNLVNGLTGHIDEITYKTRECFCYTPSMFATFIPDYVNEDSFEDMDMNSFREVRMDRQLFLQGEFHHPHDCQRYSLSLHTDGFHPQTP